MTWKTMSADAVSAGRLWTSELGLNMLERDYSSLSVPFDFAITPQLSKAAGTTDFTVVFFFPESWEVDATLDSDAICYLSCWFQLYAGINGVSDIDLEFVGHSGLGGSTQSSTPTWVRIRADLTSTMPTGETAMTVRMTVNENPGAPPVQDGSCQRAWGNGPDSRIYFTFDATGAFGA